MSAALSSEFSAEEIQSMEGYSRRKATVASLDDIWGMLGSEVKLNRDRCEWKEDCQENPNHLVLSSNPKEVEYDPNIFLNNLPRDVKLHILRQSKGNIPPKFVFHFVAQLLCPGADDDSSTGAPAAGTDWDAVKVFKSNDKADQMSKWERSDLVDMLNHAYKDANVLMEDVYCLYNSEDHTQLENMCLYQLKNLKLQFKLKKDDVDDIDLFGNEIFSWFIKYYQCQIVNSMIEDMTTNEDSRYDIADILNFFMKCNTVFGTA